VAQEEKIDTEADKRAERLKADLAEEVRNEAARQASREADIFEGKKRRVQPTEVSDAAGHGRDPPAH
jgi:hypothetical protein